MKHHKNHDGPRKTLTTVQTETVGPDMVILPRTEYEKLVEASTRLKALKAAQEAGTFISDDVYRMFTGAERKAIKEAS